MHLPCCNAPNPGQLQRRRVITRRCRTIFERRYGVWNAEYSTATQNLAALSIGRRIAESRTLLRRAIDIDRKVSGENNPQFAILLQNLATLYQKLRTA